MVEQPREVSADYVAGLNFAADIAHAEARWQTEMAGRTFSPRLPGAHTYAAERAAKTEAAIRAVARAAQPDADEGGRS